MLEGPGGPISIRIYEHAAGSVRPCLAYFHGGGWVLGDLTTHDNLCRALAVASGAVVAAVDYRLAPEHAFPDGLDDAFAATAWLFANATMLGVDPGQIGVGGDSAGANLATAVALMARDRDAFRPACQALIYPTLDFAFATPSYRENAEGYGLTRAEMIWFWEQYLSRTQDAESPYASPLRATDLTGLPPALVLTAGYDVLRDEAEAYAGRLRSAGVPTTLIRYEGMIHGFLRRFQTFDAARSALDEVARVIAGGL